MPIPSQFTGGGGGGGVHSGEKIFIVPSDLPDSVLHFLIRNMISVGDAQKSSKASNFCSLYVSL